MELLIQFLTNTGYYLADFRNVIMLFVGFIFIYLATAKKYEPLLLVPIGFGILVGNVPFFKGFGLGYTNLTAFCIIYILVSPPVYTRRLFFLALGR